MTLEELKQKRPPTVTVPDAAKIMGVTPQFLRYALLQNRLPFGIGVEMGQNEFYINTERFLLYMAGSDLKISTKPLMEANGEGLKMTEYITVKQMAERLNISLKPAYELIHSEGFPITRLNGSKSGIRISVDHLEKFLEKKTAENRCRSNLRV